MVVGGNSQLTGRGFKFQQQRVDDIFYIFVFLLETTKNKIKIASDVNCLNAKKATKKFERYLSSNFYKKIELVHFFKIK